MELKGKNMSELIEIYNQLASAKGRPQTTEFKNLAAARAAITHLEGNTMTEENSSPIEGNTPVTDATPAPAGDPSKYSTVGKRGPNQGIGEFAKQLLVAGVSTADVLAKVREQFPTAKTSASCIAYYKAALKNPLLGKRKAAADPAALRAKAEELLAQAKAAEEAAVAKAQADAEATATSAAAAQAVLDQQAAAKAAAEAQPAA